MQALKPSVADRGLSLLLERIPDVDVQVSLAARLPKQVLVRIFLEVRKSCKSWIEDCLGKRSWPVFAHVCRSWRAAAFDTPTLWAGYGRFSLKEERLGSLGPVYSATLFMVLDAKWTEIHWERLVRVIFDNCDHMKVLVLAGTQACRIMQNANKAALELMELVVHSGNARPEECRISGSKETSPFVLPSGIFKDQFPALIHLSLTNIILDLTSPLLSTNLFVLQLSRDNEHCPQTCSLPQLLNVLSTMNRLSCLTVKDILTELEDEASLERLLKDLPPVYLFWLKKLHLHIPSMHHYSGFLDKVKFRAGSTHCYLETTLDMSRMESFRMFPPSLPIDPPTDPRFEKLELHVEHPKELSFCASGEAGSLKFKVEASFASLLYLCSRLRKPLSTVQTLTFSSKMDISGQWSSFYEYLPEVEHICVDCWDLPCHMDVLVGLPKLARLEFCSPGIRPANFFIHLADALKERVQSGRSLELLVREEAVNEVVPCQTAEDIANLKQRRAPSVEQSEQDLDETEAALSKELQHRAEFQAIGDVCSLPEAE